MLYRKFGKLDWKVSALGFGAMRLPLLGNSPGNVDVPESVRMIRYAIDHGVNYVDTAWYYQGGQAEPAVGQALRDGYRQKVKLTTKLPCWLVDSIESCDFYLNKQLERLQTDRLDFYLLHALNSRYWPKLRDLGIVGWAERAIADGRIGHIGFSFHDDFALFKEIVDAYDGWTMCQIQYNYVDADYQAGTQGLKYAADRGLAVSIMEPLRGGALTRRLPEQVAKLLAGVQRERTLAEMGLLWVWDHPQVSVVLSGMSTMEQVVENVATAGRSGTGVFSEAELAVFDHAREAYQKLSPIPCTRCAYCMPCPNGVQIPRVFELYNDAIIYGDPGVPRRHYRGLTPIGLKDGERADECLECEQCMEQCPQKIPIPDWLKKAHSLLGPESKQ